MNLAQFIDLLRSREDCRFNSPTDRRAQDRRIALLSTPGSSSTSNCCHAEKLAHESAPGAAIDVAWLGDALRASIPVDHHQDTTQSVRRILDKD